jgi:rSAM/selenodomain-associated transferase 1
MTASSELTIMILAKEPRPGLVKTRLIPAVTAEQAAQLAAAALQDTMQTVLNTPASRRILVLDGCPGDWVPAGFEVLPQVSGGLEQRLAGAFGAVAGPALLIGMDTPQLRPQDLLVDLADADAWFGPSFDGGFWLIGMTVPDPTVFAGVPMSTSDTGRIQLERLLQTGRRVQQLAVHRDVDTAIDASIVAAAAPGTQFAATWRAVAD